MAQTFQQVLLTVKKENPKMKHKNALKVASKLFREQKEKEASKQEIKEETAKLEKPEVKEDIPQPKAMVFDGGLDPDVIEKKIRDAGVDINRITDIAKNYDAGFKLVIGEREGVHRKVWLEGKVRVPANGYFKVFLV